MEICR